jgi:hypothetical protein
MPIILQSNSAGWDIAYGAARPAIVYAAAFPFKPHPETA